MSDAKKIALGLVALGIPVFKVRLDADGTKTPLHERGHLDATLDPGLVDDWFSENTRALVGAYVGEAGLVALDVDVKNGKDGWDSLEKAWVEIPETFSYETPTGGTHLLYAAPADKKLAPSSNYRGLMGVDIRGGSSWVLWNGEVPKSRDEFAPAPEWMLDEKSFRDGAEFEGSLKEWFETLEPGEPNVLVRNAIERAHKTYEDRGDDLSHSDVVELQFNAIRLGAEGNPGVPALLDTIYELFMSRTGGHSRPEEEWDYEYSEGLNSGIEKHGASIELRKNLPAYSPNALPSGIPDRLIAGEPGDKNVFRELLNISLPLISDDYQVTSLLWNSPRTKDIAHEWGLEFVYQRVVDARAKPEPTRENPTLPDSETVVKLVDSQTVVSTFLSAEELARVHARKTFVDTYLAATASKGFYNRTYAVPAAWTAMSMAFGNKAFIPKGVNIGMNLWFLVLGYSGTGKTAEDEFLTDLLDAMLKDGESYYNLGANSSPEGLHLELLMRDGLASIIHHDEASDFFEDVAKKDWMSTLKDKFSKWYVGRVDPSNKISLKEYRGKSARTSFNIHMVATPDRLTSFLNTDMFGSGFLARFNWLWADPPTSDEYKYRTTFSDADNRHMVNPEIFSLAMDLSQAAGAWGGEAVAVKGSKEATKRLELAFRRFDEAAKKHEKYEVLEPAITRLGRETIWKCAALLALYEGRNRIELDDALIAVYYAQEWFETLLRVVDTTSEGEFSKDVALIEAYIRTKPQGVSESQLLHKFRSMINFSPRELTDRIEFLRTSGRINRFVLDSGKRIVYEVNGG